MEKDAGGSGAASQPTHESNETAFKIVKGFHTSPRKTDAKESRFQCMHIPAGRQENALFVQQTLVQPVFSLPRGFIEELPKIGPNEKATHGTHARCTHALQSTCHFVVRLLQQPSIFLLESMHKLTVFQHFCHAMLQISRDCMEVAQSPQHVVQFLVPRVDEAHAHSTGRKVLAETHDGMHPFIARLCQFGTFCHQGAHGISSRAHGLHRTVVDRAQVDFVRHNV
mmetsp:Transcript_6316/g.39370  ORF Transcript_6316/g.39370 Transcript_6316/m.39370 type:complete len:225 (-) Transcript_6316:1042-1716(-)